MKCVHCGAENPEGAKFCHACGQQIPEGEKQKTTIDDLKKGFSEATNFVLERQNEFQAFLDADAVDRNDTVCPYCHSTGCQPMQKSSTNVKSSGYSISNGCCGMCLLGPFGLLCGLCGTGSKVDIKNETWWTCLECGKEHISQRSAIEKADAISTSSFTNAFIGGILLALSIYRFGFSFISLILTCTAFALTLGVWVGMLDLLKEELGYSIIDILSPEKKKEYFYKFIGCIAIVLLVGLFFVPLLSRWAEE